MAPERVPNLEILFMPLEFTTWATGKPLSYTAQFGLEEGLRACGADPFTVPAFPVPRGGRDAWQCRLPDLLGGRTFDQAWVGLVHARYEESFCAWLRDRVPVRVGLLQESMAYTPGECAELPPLAGRAAHVLRQVRDLGLTHVLCSDERDVDTLEAEADVRATWCPPGVPERCLRPAYGPPASPRAAVFGDLYSAERRKLVAWPGLQDLLACPRGADAESGLPEAFDLLHRRLLHAFQDRGAAAPAVLHAYVEDLRSLRRRIFETWLAGLPAWNGIVNLPSYFKGYGGRVFECMAAGVPAVSWEVPDRPRNRALFQEGTEILLFNREDPSTLARHLANLHRDRELGRRLAEAAGQKLRAHHTSEARVREALAWIGGAGPAGAPR